MHIESAEGVTVVSLPAEFSGAAVKEFMGNIREQPARKEDKLVLDFSKTSFIDSTAIGALVSISKEYKENNRELLLRGLNDDLHELFVDTGLDKIFFIQTSLGISAAEHNLFDRSADIKLDIVRQDQNGICVLHLMGVMNHPVGSLFFKQQMLLAMADSKKILLDFEELTFFDSLSISVVLKMNKLLNETGGSMRICGANYIVDDLFSILNIDQIIPFFNTVGDAVKDWN